MILVSELRLGNYFHPCTDRGGVIIPNTKILWRVGMLDKFGKIGVIEPQNPESIYLEAKYCEPVRLSSEILQQCGFEKRFDEIRKPYGNDGDTFFMEYFEKTKRYHYTMGEGCLDGVGMEYLHQLQNFFYLVTGTELQINKLPQTNETKTDKV